MLDRLIAAGIPAAKLMPGAGACSVTEAATLIRHAVGHGVGGVLMLPPFYYKGMDDDGLFAFFAGVIDRVGSAALGCTSITSRRRPCSGCRSTWSAV